MLSSLFRLLNIMRIVLSNSCAGACFRASVRVGVRWCALAEAAKVCTYALEYIFSLLFKRFSQVIGCTLGGTHTVSLQPI